MSLTRTGDALVFGPASNGSGAAGLSGVISTSTQRKYSSEKELVGGDGEIVDIIYTGAEETITETRYDTTNPVKTNIGTGNLTTGVIMRASIMFSNEDMSKVEEEKLKIII